MAPNRENPTIMNNNNGSSSSSSDHHENKKKIIHKKQLSRLSMESLQRTISDISLELITKQALKNRDDHHDDDHDHNHDDNDDDPTVMEEATCECCGMAEEATCEYVRHVRSEFGGRVVCGLCAEAVGEEMRTGGGARDEALLVHMKDCSRFTRLGRTHPALFQAEAIKVILKKTSSSKSNPVTPRDYSVKPHTISRSSSCIPAIRKGLDN